MSETRKTHRKNSKKLSAYQVYTGEESVLLKPVPDRSRPYGSVELGDLRRQMFYEFNLSSKVWIYHERCDHAYYVKQWGKKYKQVVEDVDNPKANENVGSCSICWKLRQTPKSVYQDARDLVAHYEGILSDYIYNNAPITFNQLMIERIFYTWLYLEDYK